MYLDFSTIPLGSIGIGMLGNTVGVFNRDDLR
jgi:hypothetical protein